MIKKLFHTILLIALALLLALILTPADTSPVLADTSIIDTLEFDTEEGGWPNIIHVSGNVYAIAYLGDGSDGFLKTVTIANDGQITDMVKDTLEFDDLEGRRPNIIHVSGDVYAIAYWGFDFDGFLKTVEITPSSSDEIGFCELTADSLKNKFYLRSDNGTTTLIKYRKLSTYHPIAGDWDGDGSDGVGFCELTGNALKNKFYLRADNGTTTMIKYKKLSTLVPITGDWDGDGDDNVGFCELTGDTLKNKFYLRSDAGTTTLIKYKKDSGLVPVTGNWDGS